jgi:leader peptidase (prepilin peptidase)/N-methyltransferase
MIGPVADTGALFLIAVGPFVGSFIVTLAIRWPEGPSILTGRSVCRSCTARLAWFDLIPVLSWIVRRGCCGSCAAPIGPIYPLTELVALAIGIWAATQFGGKDLLLVCLLGWTLLALAVIDLRTMLLPDLLTLPVLGLGLFVAAADGQLSESLIGAALGFAVFALIAAVYRRWRGRDGLGLGDAKLLGAAGAWVGWTGLPSIVLIASLAALVVAMPMVIRVAGRRDQREIAFGPYLAGATWITVLYGPLVVA